MQTIDQVSYMIGNIPQMQPFATTIPRVNDFLDRFGHIDDDIVTRQGAVSEMVNRPHIRIGFHDTIG